MPINGFEVSSSETSHHSWSVVYNGATITGMGSCSSDGVGTCLCQVTGYKPSGDTVVHNVTSNPSVASNTQLSDYPEECENTGCGNACVEMFGNESTLMSLFGHDN